MTESNIKFKKPTRISGRNSLVIFGRVSLRPIANRAPPEKFKRIYLDHVEAISKTGHVVASILTPMRAPTWSGFVFHGLVYAEELFPKGLPLRVVPEKVCVHTAVNIPLRLRRLIFEIWQTIRSVCQCTISILQSGF